MKKSFLTLKAVVFTLFIVGSIAITSCTSNSSDPVIEPTQSTTITAIASRTPALSTLVAALTRTDLAATLDASGTYTVFAPTNDAFNTFFATLPQINGAAPTVNNVDVAVLKQVLLNHVSATKYEAADLPNGAYIKTLATFGALATPAVTNGNELSMFVDKSNNAVKLNGVSTVTAANIAASNGVVHVVDTVIGLPTIVDHAKANSNFSTLVAALVFNPANNFVATLSTTTGTTQPFTVFAPTNAAFTAFLTEINATGLADIPAATLTKVLKYHVITGANALAASLTDNQSIPTFEGSNITVQKTTTGGVTTVKIKDTTTGRAACTVIIADVQCSNGVIHALDKVLLPI